MGVWKSTSGVSVFIDPFMNNGYRFIKLELKESIGGEIASGSASLVHDGSNKALELITNQWYLDIEITKDKGSSYKIKAFIVTRKFIKNSMDITFICIPNKEFISDRRNLEWSDPNSVLESLWKGTSSIRCSSDLNNNLTLLQANESDYTFLKKIAYSYKKNTIFSLGLEGFMIKDIVGVDSFGNKEPGLIIIEGKDVSQKSSYNINYNYNLYVEPEMVYEDDPEFSTNLEVISLLSNSYIVQKDFSGLMDNYLYNTNLMNSRLYNSVTVVSVGAIPDYKLGDTVRYRRSDESEWLPFNVYIVASNSIFISTEDATDGDGNMMSCTTVLRGIDQGGGNFLSKEDPVN